MFAEDIKTEQVYKETAENLELIALAKDRARNGRRGDRALYELVEQQRVNLNSAIRKRKLALPFLDSEELELSCIEQIVRRLDTYDPKKGQKFSTWAYFGILSGIDTVVRNELKAHQAQLETQYILPSYSEASVQDISFLEKIFEQIGGFSEYVQKVIKLVTEGWSYVKIGEMLGKREDAVRMAYKRGIKKIQKILTPPQPAPELELEPESDSESQEYSKPIITRIMGWCQEKFSRFVRFWKQPRKEECPTKKSPEKSMTMNNDRRFPSQMNDGEVPLSYYLGEYGDTVDGQQFKEALFKIMLRWRRFGRFVKKPMSKFSIIAVLGFCLLYLLHGDPASAQCTGWLCGAHDKIVANDMWGAGQTGANTIIGGIFIMIQVLALVLVSLPILVAVTLGIRKEDYTPFAIGSVVIFVTLVAINFMVGWLFGVV